MHIIGKWASYSVKELYGWSGVVESGKRISRIMIGVITGILIAYACMHVPVHIERGRIIRTGLAGYCSGTPKELISRDFRIWKKETKGTWKPGWYKR